MRDYLIRPFEEKDAIEAAGIFYAAVHIGAAGHYSEQQRNAWAPQIPETEAWRQQLLSQNTYVAQAGSRLIGFMTLDDTGYIDLAFIAPAWIGKGVAKALYERIEDQAHRMELKGLTAEASHMARIHFERQGWSVIKRQSIEKNNVTIVNFLMEKHL